MDLYINGRFLTQKITGVQRYAIETIKAFDKLLYSKTEKRSDYKITILVPKNYKSNLKLTKIKIKKVGNLRGHLWEQFELPFFSRQGFLLNLCNTAPILKRRQCVSIHDMAVFSNPNNFSFLFRNYYKFLFSFTSRFSERIVTVSNFSKEEIIKYLKISPKKIKVIYEGHEHILNIYPDLNFLKENCIAPFKYVLGISSLNPNKNFNSIVKAIEIGDFNDMKFVFAGGENNKIFKKETIKSLKNIVPLGYITDQQLKTLYQNAFCFIFPSFYEGFGLPPLEAMACGCPVIVSNIPPLQEVCGPQSLYCDPKDPISISKNIKTLINNPNYRNQMSEYGKKRCLEFSWDKAAKEYLVLLSN